MQNANSIDMPYGDTMAMLVNHTICLNHVPGGHLILPKKITSLFTVFPWIRIHFKRGGAGGWTKAFISYTFLGNRWINIKARISQKLKLRNRFFYLKTSYIYLFITLGSGLHFKRKPKYPLKEEISTQNAKCKFYWHAVWWYHGDASQSYDLLESCAWWSSHFTYKITSLFTVFPWIRIHLKRGGAGGWTKAFISYTFFDWNLLWYSCTRSISSGLSLRAIVGARCLRCCNLKPLTFSNLSSFWETGELISKQGFLKKLKLRNRFFLISRHCIFICS